MKIRLRYIVEDTDRHGNVRIYYRRRGRLKVRLPRKLNAEQRKLFGKLAETL